MVAGFTQNSTLVSLCSFVDFSIVKSLSLVLALSLFCLLFIGMVDIPHSSPIYLELVIYLSLEPSMSRAMMYGPYRPINLVERSCQTS